MIDIHSHILHGVDDGAQSLDDSIKMLKIAIENGVTTQVLTPHIQAGRYNNSPEYLNKLFLKFISNTQILKLPIKILLSAEVRIEPGIFKLLEKEDFPWLGTWDSKRVFLLEMPHNHLPVGSDNLAAKLIMHDILPVIVHPERNRELQCDIRKLSPFIDMGCMVQVTAGSITGNFGDKAKKVGIKLLKEGVVTLLATDCHNITYRPPDLKSGWEVAKNILGEKKANELVKENPGRLCGV